MKLIVVAVLVFIKSFFLNYCCKAEALTASEEAIQKKYDPNSNLLSKFEIAFIKSLPVDKQEAVADLYKNKKRLEKQIIFYRFNCASRVTKNLLEYFNEGTGDSTFPGIYGVRLYNDDSCSHTIIPESDMAKIKIFAEVDARKTNVNKVVSLIRRWYCFLSRNLLKISKRINANLQTYYEKNKNSYNDLTALRIRFSASVAISTSIFNFIDHSFLPRLQDTKFDGTANDEFTNYLFTEWPSYFFNYEDVDFLNILASSRSNAKIDGDSLLKYILVQNFECNNELVAIPLSDKCPKQEFIPTHFNPPPFTGH